MREIQNVFGKTYSDGGHTSTSSNHNYLIHSQDFQGNKEILSPTFLHAPTDHDDVEHSTKPTFSNSNLFPFGVGSVGYSNPHFLSEENDWQAQTMPSFNSLGLVDGIARTVMESDMFVDETQYLLGMTVNLLDELDDDLINGPW
ncbi:hypothetical protein Lser_V15G37148 [Lactuca serriola]